MTVHYFTHIRDGLVARFFVLLTYVGLCPLWAAQAPDQGAVIAAYGRVSPGERAVTLTAPYCLNSPPIVTELLVKEGDHVFRGQVLAVTQNQELASADLALAKAQLATVEKRLRALNTEPKSEDIAAQDAFIESLEAEARAEKAKKRPDTTAGRNEASAREDAAIAKVTMSQHQLEAMRQVRPADLAVVQAEVEEAKAAVARSETLLGFHRD